MYVLLLILPVCVRCPRSLYDVLYEYVSLKYIYMTFDFLTLNNILSLLALYNYRNLRIFTTEKILYCGGAVKINSFRYACFTAAPVRH
jgi:hypothetical protein